MCTMYSFDYGIFQVVGMPCQGVPTYSHTLRKKNNKKNKKNKLKMKLGLVCVSCVC